MKQSIQHKIGDLKKLAQASRNISSNEKKTSIEVQDSLAKAITNKKEASLFLAELEAAIKLAQEK